MTVPQNPMLFLLPILQSLARVLGSGRASPAARTSERLRAQDKYPILVQFGSTFNVRMDDLCVDQL
jgi:hypothetical protein